MKLTEKEKAARRAAFRQMPFRKKLEHIYLYYKWPVLLCLIVLSILGSWLHQQMTKKEPVLYLALANVTIGPDLEEDLTEGFLRASGGDPTKEEVYLYRNLYVSEETDEVTHEYAYASRMKIMGAIQAQRMDLVLMSQEAYDMFSGSGYLLPLEDGIAQAEPALLPELTACLVSNEVVLSDNSIEWQLGETDTLTVTTETVANGFSLEDAVLLQSASFGEPLYLGIIANSPRLPAALRYTGYLLDGR